MKKQSNNSDCESYDFNSESEDEPKNKFKTKKQDCISNFNSGNDKTKKKKSDSSSGIEVDIDSLENEDSEEPEIHSKKNKLKKNPYTDLISHEKDYSGAKFKKEEHIRRQKRIVEIKKIKQHKQKSIEWLEQRKECLTATAIATALDEDPYKHPAYLLLEKCERCPAFIQNTNCHHGNKYEDIINMYYEFRNNIKVAEYGMIQHAKYRFVGASPDGICEKDTKDGKGLSTLVGRLLEIKCPATRKINFVGNLDGDICPHYYFVQVQTQLFVTDMNECDFLQCKISEYNSYDEFVKDSDPRVPTLSKSSGKEKGCIIQLLPRKFVRIEPEYDPNEERITSKEKETDDEYMSHLLRSEYIYPDSLHLTPEEIKQWIANQVLNYHTHEHYKTHMIDRVIYFKFTEIACHLIKRDPEYFTERIKILGQFWDYILFYQEHPKQLNNLVKFVKDVGMDKSDIIFEKINKDYLRVNKKSKYEPLYQEKGYWRSYYDKKYAKFRKT